MNSRPYCLSIGGFDPCGGAGVLADIKTFEMNGCQGMAVITSNTTQTEDAFFDVEWMDLDRVLYQIKVLTERYSFGAIKIGLVKDTEMLRSILHHLPHSIPVVWDPILKASAGFTFHAGMNLDGIAERCTLITPNLMEFEALWGDVNALDISQIPTAILLKGGHSLMDKGTDVLIQTHNRTELKGKSFGNRSKHGTGCVLSAAITASLARGNGLMDSCIMGKRYVEEFILSNESNLGYHHCR